MPKLFCFVFREGEGRAKLVAQRTKIQELQGATKRLSITSEKDEDENDKVSTFSSSCSLKSLVVSIEDSGYLYGSSDSSQSDYSLVDISNTNSKLCTCLSELHDTQASPGACSQFLTQTWQVQSSPFNRNQVSSASPTAEAETWTASPNTDIQQNSPSSIIPAQKQNFISTQSSNFDKFDNGVGTLCHAGSFPPKLKTFSSAGDCSCGSCSNDDYHSPNSNSSSKLSVSSSTVGKKRQRQDSLDELDSLYGMALGATDSSDINLETDEKDEHSAQGIMGFCDGIYELSNSRNYRPDVTKPVAHREERHGMSRLRQLLESEPGTIFYNN
ncbi:hypothetical protein CHS0354_011597 [Potamilus streckersoni]|uniref:Uncharacterized protein n=1 Tax=Potamilus streckersoni TaxID=2493646 RepID=A0AAE0WB34_9BIVA|nr:hypothetical protein CHS0354_011597 [Potamilus streckersoni]